MSSPLDGMVQQLRWLALAGANDGVPDGELIHRFLSRSEEDAFAALVHRHGPIVYGSQFALARG